MTREYNIIGDIAGEYNTLIALVDKMPSTATVLSLGDMVDRGPKSKEVLEWIKANGEAIMGNHDHMMYTEYARTGYYRGGVWLWNGGGHTLQSFFPEVNPNMHTGEEYEEYLNRLPKNLMEWVKDLSLYKELEPNKDGLKGFVSHAIKNPSWPLETAIDLGESINSRRGEDTIIWNRGSPRRMKDCFQICGHNSHWGFKIFSDKEGDYAMCIDTSRSRILTGVHWPSMEVFQQEYVRNDYTTGLDLFESIVEVKPSKPEIIPE